MVADWFLRPFGRGDFFECEKNFHEGSQKPPVTSTSERGKNLALQKVARSDECNAAKDLCIIGLETQIKEVRMDKA